MKCDIALTVKWVESNVSFTVERRVVFDTQNEINQKKE